jgi:hypothetical protein
MLCVVAIGRMVNTGGRCVLVQTGDVEGRRVLHLWRRIRQRRRLLLHLLRWKLKRWKAARLLRIVVRHVAVGSMDRSNERFELRASLSYGRTCVSSSGSKHSC